MVEKKQVKGIELIVQNRQARHEYEIIDAFEAGIVLQGTEVKSLRTGKANLKDSYAAIENGQLFLFNLHISPYGPGSYANHAPERPRKLLVHRYQLRRLFGRIQQQGLTLVPLRLYFKSNRAKVELALVRGKRQFDKRHDIAWRQAQRDIERALKDRDR